MKKLIRRKTLTELKAAIYEDRGWKRQAGQSMASRIKREYNVMIDWNSGDLIAYRKPEEKDNA